MQTMMALISVCIGCCPLCGPSQWHAQLLLYATGSCYMFSVTLSVTLSTAASRILPHQSVGCLCCSYNVRYIYCWHGLPAYWGGVMPDTPALAGVTGSTLVYPKPTSSIAEVEPSLLWSPAVLAGESSPLPLSRGILSTHCRDLYLRWGAGFLSYNVCCCVICAEHTDNNMLRCAGSHGRGNQDGPLGGGVLSAVVNSINPVSGLLASPAASPVLS